MTKALGFYALLSFSIFYTIDAVFMSPPSQYDKTALPSAENYTAISLTLFINALVVDAKNEVLSVDAEIYYTWIDDRLKFDAEILGSENVLTSLKNIWTPDVQFSNSKNIREISWTPEENSATVDKVGNVKHKIRLQIDSRCPSLSGRRRTYLTTECKIRFQSYRHNSDQVQFILNNNSIHLSPEISVGGYTLVNLYSSPCSSKLVDSKTVCLEVRLGLEKDFITSLFLSGVYLSSFLLVIISWISFWLDGSRMLERLLLGISVTAILALYQIGAALYTTETVGHHSIDGWLAFCTTLVLASLIEFGFAHVVLKVVPAKTKAVFRVRYGNENEDESTAENQTMEKLGKVIDVACGSLVFPLIFIVYNLFYWTTYSA